MRTIVTNSARCKKCGDVVTSAFRHDYQECKCKAIAVDGGHSYLIRTGNAEDIEELSVMREEKDSGIKETDVNADGTHSAK